MDRMPEEFKNPEEKPQPESILMVDQVALLERYPQLKEIPPHHMEIIIMTLAGFGAASIAERAKCSTRTIYNVLDKYDMRAIVEKGVEMQRLLLANQLGSMAVEAMMELKNKIPDLRKMSPTALLNFITGAIELSDMVRPKFNAKKQAESDLVDQLKQ